MRCNWKDSNRLFLILLNAFFALFRFRNRLGISFLFFLLIVAGTSELKSEMNEGHLTTPIPEKIIAPETLPTATVNGREVSVGRFNKLYKNRIGTIRLPEGKKIPWSVALRIKINIVSELIDEALVEDAARSKGIMIANSEINNKMQEVVATFPDKKKFQNYLSSLPGGLERLGEMTRFRLLKERLAGAEGLEPVSDDEARQFYEQNSSQFNFPAHLTVQDILFLVKRDESKEKDKVQKEKANKILAEVQKPGVSFSIIARRHSEGKSAKVGGFLGRVTEKSIDPLLWKVLKTMKPDQVSDVIKGLEGYHILKLVRENEEIHKTFEETKEDIKRQIQARRYAAKVAELMAHLRATAEIENHLQDRYQTLINYSQKAYVPSTSVSGNKAGIDSLPETIPINRKGAFTIKRSSDQ